MRHIGKLYFGCQVCALRVARHRVDGKRFCCQCYVRSGETPADWHPECVAEYKRREEEKAKTR